MSFGNLILPWKKTIGDIRRIPSNFPLELEDSSFDFFLPCGCNSQGHLSHENAKSVMLQKKGRVMDV